MKGHIFYHRIRTWAVITELQAIQMRINEHGAAMGQRAQIAEIMQMCLENSLVEGWADEYETYLPC